MRVTIVQILFVIICSNLYAQDNYYREDPRIEDQSYIYPDENVDEKIKKNIFLHAEVTKKECFVGEGIMASFKAYSRLKSASSVLKRPSLAGFSVIEMVDTYNSLPETEKYDGIFYNTHLIRKVHLFALQPGNFTLEPAEIESTIHLTQLQKREGPLKKILGDYRSGHLVQKNLSLSTEPVTIHVKPLPSEKQPEDFSGGVGQFSVDLRIVDSTANQFQPAVLQIVVSGTGNLPLITDPEIEWPEGNRPSGPLVTENFNKYAYPLTGEKIFEFTVPTPDTGVFEIPPVTISYFDPEDRKYKRSESKSLRYTVSAAPKEPAEIIDAAKSTSKNSLPLHYIYFGIVVAAIAAIIIFQLRRGGKN